MLSKITGVEGNSNIKYQTFIIGIYCIYSLYWSVWHYVISLGLIFFILLLIIYEFNTYVIFYYYFFFVWMSTTVIYHNIAIQRASTWKIMFYYLGHLTLYHFCYIKKLGRKYISFYLYEKKITVECLLNVGTQFDSWFTYAVDLVRHKTKIYLI